MASATMTLIASQVLGSSTANVTFSSIPQTYTDLKLICSTNMASGSADYALLLQFNGDTTSNYSYTFLRGTGTAVNSGNTASNTSAVGVNLAGNGSNSGFSFSEMYIPNYTSTTSKQILISGAEETNSTTTNMTINSNSYRGTSAISSILVFNSGGGGPQFAANSSFYLYGIKNS